MTVQPTIVHVRVINAATGELIRELAVDPARDSQPAGQAIRAQTASLRR